VRINQFSLMSLILLVAFTVVITFLTVVETNRIRTYYEGDPERSDFKPNDKLKREKSDLETAIAGYRNEISTREREIWRLDLALAAHRVDFSEADLLAGVALPDHPTGTIRGKEIQLKDTAWKLSADRIAASVKRLELLRQEYESAARQTHPPLDESITARQDELQVILKRISDQEALFQKDRDELTKKLDDIAAAREKSEKQQREDFSRRATKIAQLEDRIRGLLELELKWVEELEADGSILEVAPGTVVIDLGSRERVAPGALFTVFNHDKGEYVEKGRIEVIATQDTIATARLLTQYDERRNPIGKGDFIGNPVFDAHKPKVFVVAGEFKRYNKEDLEHFIQATGAIVTQELGPGCDFLVAGERSDREQANARQYQIQAMREDLLLTFVTTTFGPKKP
jgi:hypothetical protein